MGAGLALVYVTSSSPSYTRYYQQNAQTHWAGTLKPKMLFLGYTSSTANIYWAGGTY